MWPYTALVLESRRAMRANHYPYKSQARAFQGISSTKDILKFLSYRKKKEAKF